MPALGKLLEPYRSVSLIGMCKNAGKTTVLNRIIRESAHKCLALSSIGRDGESQDLVTGTQKPGIYVPEGTLLATAAELLSRSDMTREILDTTGVFTPLGEVVVFRAKSDGSVELAGPSITTQLGRLREQFFALGAEQVLFDGALSRKSLCSRQVTEATILCSGASYHKNMDIVVADTAYQCRLLTLPEVVLSSVSEDERCILPYAKGEFLPMRAEEALKAGVAGGLFFGGALSEFALRPFLELSLKDVTLTVRDSSKILLKEDAFQKLLRRGADFAVLESVNPVAVTVNPFSAYGFHFGAEEFYEKMARAVHLPVFDVRREAT
jgi:hypothetical protein